MSNEVKMYTYRHEIPYTVVDGGKVGLVATVGHGPHVKPNVLPK